jgi:hypothetical protein
MLHIIARIIETIAASRTARESKAHAQRKAQRKAREAYAAEYTQAQRSMRDRNPYPFHQ